MQKIVLCIKNNSAFITHTLIVSNTFQSSLFSFHLASSSAFLFQIFLESK